MTITPLEAEKRYGQIINGIWENEEEWCMALPIPSYIAQSWINTATSRPTNHVYCNKDMAPSLLRALINLHDRGILSELKTFDGCYMVRDIRGVPGKVSAHAYAGAIDLNAKENRLGRPCVLSDGFKQCFKDEGFTCGADFIRIDGMHMSWLGW